MRTPPLLMGAALLFWGWQSGYWGIAAVFAAVLESSRIFRIRWDFSEQDSDRLWNLCTVLFLGAAAYAFTSTEGPSAVRDWLGSPASPAGRTAAANQAARALLALIQWLPMVFFPFMAAQAFGRRETVDWSTISWILRWTRPRTRRTGGGRRPVNLSYAYLALGVLAGCVGRPESVWAYGGLAVLVIWALWPARSPRFKWPVWAGLVAVALALGFLGNRGLERLYGYVQNYSPGWLTARLQGRFEARENRTSIGALGPLKLSGKIVLRVEPGEGQTPPSLLREAAYDTFRSPTWQGAGSGRDLQPIAPEANGTTWMLRPRRTNESRLSVAATLPGGRGLLPLAHGTLRLERLPAEVLQTNRLGAVRADPGPGFLLFDQFYSPGSGIDSPPTAEDLKVPGNEMVALVQLATELNLDARRPQASLDALAAFFQDRFSYSLAPAPPSRAPGGPTPLSAFLLERRSGHCEYFATAAVLLLRTAGIPARYAVGYAVQERSGRGYVVRRRHAHAWCLVHQDGAWREFDPTPGSFWASEAARASWFEPLADAWSRAWLEFTRLRYGQSNLRRYLLWLIPALLAMSLWQLVAGRTWKRSRVPPGPRPVRVDGPGRDSEFYQVEQLLTARGLVRPANESLADWWRRIRSISTVAAEGAAFESLLRLHARYRFDPDGLNPGEREELRERAKACLESLRTASPRPESEAGRAPR